MTVAYDLTPWDNPGRTQEAVQHAFLSDQLRTHQLAYERRYVAGDYKAAERYAAVATRLRKAISEIGAQR